MGKGRTQGRWHQACTDEGRRAGCVGHHAAERAGMAPVLFQAEGRRLVLDAGRDRGSVSNMEHGTRDHAKYGGSVIERISLCPGSAKLARTVPRVETSYSRDGTEAHELLDYALKNRMRDARTAAFACNRVLPDEDKHDNRCNAVQDCLDYVWDIIDAYGEDQAQLWVEHRFVFPSFITDEAYGTCDIAIYIPLLRLLYVIDYKHGVGVSVDAFENKQTLFYATGSVEGSNDTGVAFDADTIVTAIVQPRCFNANGPIREYTVDRSRLRAFINEVDDIITRAESPNAPLVPGEKQCQFCPASAMCPAREAQAVSLFSDHFKSVKDINSVSMPAPEGLTPERVAYILEVKSFIMGWFEDVETQARQMALDGIDIPNHKLVEAQAKRKWDGDPIAIAQQLMQLMGTQDWDLVMPRKLITITDADARVKAVFKAQVKSRPAKKKAAEAAVVALSNLTVKDSSGVLSLVHVTDKRPAADRAALAFQTVKAIPAPNT